MSDQGQESAKPHGGASRPTIDIIGPRVREIERFMEDLKPLFSKGDEPLPIKPRMDVAETSSGLELTFEAPGLEPGDLEITLLDGLLTVRGQKPCLCEPAEKHYCQVECGHGDFSWPLDLPPDARADGVTATLSKGLLTIVVPVGGAPEPRRIEVRGAD
jgi:HSP20 family protein